MTILRFREVDRNMFETVKDNKKKVETRAATIKYKNIKPGDKVKIVCGKDYLIKTIKSVNNFKSIIDLTKSYKIQDINPFVDSYEELEKMYYGYPGYREKIKKFGLIVFDLE